MNNYLYCGKIKLEVTLLISPMKKITSLFIIHLTKKQNITKNLEETKINLKNIKYITIYKIKIHKILILKQFKNKNDQINHLNRYKVSINIHAHIHTSYMLYKKFLFSHTPKKDQPTSESRSVHAF